MNENATGLDPDLDTAMSWSPDDSFHTPPPHELARYRYTETPEAAVELSWEVPETSGIVKSFYETSGRPYMMYALNDAVTCGHVSANMTTTSYCPTLGCICPRFATQIKRGLSIYIMSKYGVAPKHPISFQHTTPIVSKYLAIRETFDEYGEQPKIYLKGLSPLERSIIAEIGFTLTYSFEEANVFTDVLARKELRTVMSRKSLNLACAKAGDAVEIYFDDERKNEMDFVLEPYAYMDDLHALIMNKRHTGIEDWEATESYAWYTNHMANAICGERCISCSWLKSMLNLYPQGGSYGLNSPSPTRRL